MTYSYQPAYDFRAKAHYAQVYYETEGKKVHLFDTQYRKDRNQIAEDAAATIAAIKRAAR